MAWVYVIGAGIFEIIWAYAMKQSSGFSRLWPTVIMLVTMTLSIGLLTLSMRALPLGTAYSVFTGIGTVGAFVLGIVVLGEQASALRFAGAALIVTGLIVMKLSGGE